MKAAYINELGAPDVLKYGDMPDPVPGPGQVLVDVHAASINAADYKVRQGKSAMAAAGDNFPYIMGRDFSGVVCGLAEGVTDFKIGDEVFGICDRGVEGAYAEKVTVSADIIALKPKSLTHVEAAAIALVSLTALISIEDVLKLKAGEKILVQGGAGGVASIAIQMAKHIGATVITTASANNHEYVKSLGADQVIDYNKEDFTKVISDCDVVFETVGGETVMRSFDVLKPGGRAAFIAAGLKAPTPPREDLISLRPQVGRGREYLERIIALFEKGAIKLPEIKTYKLSEAIAAHTLSESRHFRGKLVFKVR